MELNKKQIDYISDKLNRLTKSKFRTRFKLSKDDFEYIDRCGMEKIEEHAKDFILKRLSVLKANDGKQTPMRGHPVFVAQHATATCCRGCIEKWYKIPKDRPLNEREVKFILALIISFINKEKGDFSI